MQSVPPQRQSRVSFLIGGPNITTTMHVRMLDSLFSQKRITIAGTILALVVGCITYTKLHWSWLWFWMGAVVATALIRDLLSASYARRADDTALQSWAVGFAVTAWAVGGIWGTILFAVLGFGNDDGLKIITIIAAAGVVAGGATRNHGSPAAVVGQVLLIELPTIVGMLVGGTALVNWVVSGFSFLNILVTLSNATHLMAQTTAILMADARNLELVAQLSLANDSLLASNAALETVSLTDELTGVMNRRGLMVALDRIWRHGARMTTPVGAIIIDIDHFKRFNDYYGHLEGDNCLRIVAGILAATLNRPDDLCARYGGEEFVVVLPGADQEGCIHVAETLRAAVEARGISHSASDLGRVSISLGVAVLIPRTALRSIDLLATADQALYRAKTLGRNRWEFSDAVAVD